MFPLSLSCVCLCVLVGGVSSVRVQRIPLRTASCAESTFTCSSTERALFSARRNVAASDLVILFFAAHSPFCSERVSFRGQTMTSYTNSIGGPAAGPK